MNDDKQSRSWIEDANKQIAAIAGRVREREQGRRLVFDVPAQRGIRP